MSIVNYLREAADAFRPFWSHQCHWTSEKYFKVASDTEYFLFIHTWHPFSQKSVYNIFIQQNNRDHPAPCMLSVSTPSGQNYKVTQSLTYNFKNKHCWRNFRMKSVYVILCKDYRRSGLFRNSKKVSDWLLILLGQIKNCT